MTLNEFKAWLEGFEEAIDGAPTEAQWKKLREKIRALTGPDMDQLEWLKRAMEKTHPDKYEFRKYDPIPLATPQSPTAVPGWPYDRTIVVSGGASTNPLLWNGTTWTAWNGSDVPRTFTGIPS